MVAAGLAIILLVKPLTAVVIVAALGYPARTALVVAVGLAQIGEFSFILAQVGRESGLMPEDGTQLLVATAIISITINPVLFRSLDRIERGVQRWPWMWHILNSRSDRRAAAINATSMAAIEASERPLAIIVGYGPVGRVVDALLRDAAFETVIIDMNIDAVRTLTKSGRVAIYGDATRRDVLDQAGVRRAAHLVVTLPHKDGRSDLVMAARELSPSVAVTVRARYLAERETLEQAGANRIVFEEGEAGVALARNVMEARGMDVATIDRMLEAIRKIWKMRD
jgi:CPA2 family monovalent cation:H+ antiporter-2